MNRLFRIGAPFVAAALTVGLVSVLASAHDTDLTDPNDARGKLDVSAVRLAHQTGPVAWTVVTFAGWGIQEMWDRGYIMVLIDTKTTDEAEYYLLIRSNRQSLEGSFWRAHTFGPDTYLGIVPVSRLSRRSATVKVRLSRLEFAPNRKFYRWWVETLFTSDVCPRTCYDRAPNRSTVLQWRPGMSPTPSSTPSSTPSPSDSPTP